MKSSIQGLGEKTPFEKGSCTITVDIGGGTIDCITHKIVSYDPLQLEESCCGEAGKSGSTSIDRALYELLSKRFGEAFERVGPGLLGRMMEEFEKAKRGFQGADMEVGKTYELHLPMELDANDDSWEDMYDFLDHSVIITRYV